MIRVKEQKKLEVSGSEENKVEEKNDDNEE